MDRLRGSVLALAIAAPVLSTPAIAIDVAVAKRCNSLLAKAFPPRQLGNPAAGSAKGNGKDAREYFAKCIAAEGKIEESAR